MNEYLALQIKNLQPLKIGSRGVQNQIENSKSHIPGSTIRGAVIHYVSKQLKLDKNLYALENEKRKYKKELLENMKCYNAYPYNDGLFFPNPMNLRTNKHRFREAIIDKNEKFEEFGDLLKETEYINTIPLSYIAVKDSVIKSIQIKKEFRLHHNKGKSKDNLFRYEAIKKGHAFRTILYANEKIIDALEQSLKKNNKWHLGGSKSSGYGLCQIEVLYVGSAYEEAKEQIGLSFKAEKRNKLIITCLSDCILRDEQGNPCNHISASELENIIGKKNIKLARAIVDQGYSEGYNMTWGLRYPKESTVKAGSVIEYICDELNEEDLKKIEKNLYGMRTTDGYGWIVANIEYPNKIDLSNNSVKKLGEDKEKKSVNDLDLKDKSIDIIINGLDKAKGKWLRHIAIKEGLTKGSNKITNSMRQNMLRGLKEMNLSETFLSRSTLNDKNEFSIAGCNYKEIYDYLKSNENSILHNYASNKLNTTKGNLFYKDRNKDFLKNLAVLSLKLGGADYEQDN